MLSSSWNKCLVVLTLGLLVLIPRASFAQVSGSSILGVVRDSSGSAIAHATLDITSLTSGFKWQLVTDASGSFAATNLQPSTYQLVVEAPGFTPKTISGITLTVGGQRQIDIVLGVAGVKEVLQVYGVEQKVDLTTSELSNTVQGQTILDLPLNGRDWTQLATLDPGVSTIRNQTSVSPTGFGGTKATRGFGSQLSIDGARSSQNNYRLDGASFNDYTNDSPGAVLGSLAGTDAIQEFTVLTTNYSAEYGKTSGGVINALTRSGANELHGDVYEFIRNSALDARNYFDGTTKPPFRRNQFGGSLGGPILKNKLFYFGNYEGIRQVLSTTQISTVPSPNARQGILSTGDVTVNSKITPYLAFWPTPNKGLYASGDTGEYSVATPQDGSEDFITTRIDYKISQKDSLGGTFYYDRSQTSEPDALFVLHFQQHNSRPFGTIEETHIFSPTFTNTVRFGFNRNLAVTGNGDPINSAGGESSLGAIPGRDAPLISVTGLTSFMGGTGGYYPFRFGWNSFQGYDDAFITRGKHSVKIGFAVEHMQSNNKIHYLDNGSFAFKSLANFLTNVPYSFQGNPPDTGTEVGLRETLYAGYLQDDWRLSPRLTLNAGLRYEMVTVPTEVNGKLSTLRNMTDTVPHIGSPYFANPTKKNFEPRVGFAWSPFADENTSIRGGFGFYDVLPLPYEFLVISSSSYPINDSVSLSNLPAGAFPDLAYADAVAANSGNVSGQRFGYVDPTPSRSYVLQWNLNIEHQFGNPIIVRAAYVGSRGVHLPFRSDDADIVMPTKTSAGYLWPTYGTGVRLNPSIYELDRLDTSADSYYEALQLGTTVHVDRHLDLQVSYTWGKTIDTGSSTIAGNQYTNSPSNLPLWFDPSLRRSVADFNLGQNLVASGTWKVFPQHVHPGTSGLFLSNWRLGAIFQASSGAPFTALIEGDPLGMVSTAPYDYPNRLRTSGCGSAINPGNAAHYIKTECFETPSNPLLLGNSGRNSLVGPGLVNTDFSIAKNGHIPWLSERLGTEFRAEAFNIFNRANFAPPLTNNAIFNDITNSTTQKTTISSLDTAGVITSTQTSSRQLQFTFKVIW